MLGAVKGDAQSQTSLFRLLSRRWRPLAKLKPSQPAFPALAEEEKPQPASKWINASPPPRYAPTMLPPRPTRPARSAWSPWQWVK